MKENVFAFAGAIVGGLVGYLAFFWIVRQGFYGLILPGALLGLGAGIFPNRSTVLCVICGFLALALGLLAEWRFEPFIKDEGLIYFLTHVHQLRPITLIMIAAGAFIGFWSPFRHREVAKAAGTTLS
jgi:hypothetical protein